MSKTFNSIEDLTRYLKENPEEIIKQNIGKKISIDCPICKKETKAEFIDEKTLKCEECQSELNAVLIVHDNES